MGPRAGRKHPAVFERREMPADREDPGRTGFPKVPSAGRGFGCRSRSFRSGIAALSAGVSAKRQTVAQIEEGVYRVGAGRKKHLSGSRILPGMKTVMRKRNDKINFFLEIVPWWEYITPERNRKRETAEKKNPDRLSA